MVHGSSPVKPETAEGVGIPPPATKWPAEGIYVTLVDSRVEWCRRWVRGWPELSPASTLAVAGVRVRSNSRLRDTARPVEWCYGFLRVR